MKVQSMESQVNVLVLYVVYIIYTFWAEGFSVAAKIKDLEDNVFSHQFGILGLPETLITPAKLKAAVINWYCPFFIGLMLV